MCLARKSVEVEEISEHNGWKILKSMRVGFQEMLDILLLKKHLEDVTRHQSCEDTLKASCYLAL